MTQITTAHYKLEDRATNYAQQQGAMMHGLELLEKDLRGKLALFDNEKFTTSPNRAIPNPANPDDDGDWFRESTLLIQLEACLEAQGNLNKSRRLTTRNIKGRRYVSDMEICQTRRFLNQFETTDENTVASFED